MPSDPLDTAIAMLPLGLHPQTLKVVCGPVIVDLR